MCDFVFRAVRFIAEYCTFVLIFLFIFFTSIKLVCVHCIFRVFYVMLLSFRYTYSSLVRLGKGLNGLQRGIFQYRRSRYLFYSRLVVNLLTTRAFASSSKIKGRYPELRDRSN
jgi:hypothetical protein